MKIINFEHGLTSGFAMRNKYYINFSEALYCNIMFVANNAAKKEYERCKIKNVAKIYTIGVPEQIKGIAYKGLIRKSFEEKV